MTHLSNFIITDQQEIVNIDHIVRIYVDMRPRQHGNDPLSWQIIVIANLDTNYKECGDGDPRDVDDRICLFTLNDGYGTVDYENFRLGNSTHEWFESFYQYLLCNLQNIRDYSEVVNDYEKEHPLNYTPMDEAMIERYLKRCAEHDTPDQLSER